MTNINRDPLLRVIYDAAQAIEACGASEALTAAVMAVTEIYQHAERVLDDRDALHAEFDGTRAELAQARAERDAARARVEAAERDAELLDWLSTHPREATIRIGGDMQPAIFWGISAAPGTDMRAAIDAARAEEESDE